MVKPKYYLVERTPLPEVFQRVIEANEAIASGQLVALLKARFKLTLPQQIKPPLTQPVEVALVLRNHLAHRLHDTHRLSGKK